MTFQKDKIYRIKSGSYKDQEYQMMGNWKEHNGESWIVTLRNPACIQYMIRVKEDKLPIDDNVYYGHIGLFGHLVHESEIGEEIVKEDD
jgi:hypothetical protein